MQEIWARALKLLFLDLMLWDFTFGRFISRRTTYSGVRRNRKLAASARAPDIVTEAGSAPARNNLSLVVPYLRTYRVRSGMTADADELTSMMNVEAGARQRRSANAVWYPQPR
jgi:hypothetical protein